MTFNINANTAKWYDFTVPNDEVIADVTNFPLVLVPPVESGFYDDIFEMGQRQNPNLPAPKNHWTFDNIDGTTLKDERHSIDGTMVNLSTKEGAFGLGLQGDNTGATARYVDFGSGKVEFGTIILWVKRYSPTSYTEFILSDGTTYFAIRPSTSGYYLFSYDTSNGAIDTDLAISDNTSWHQVAFVKSAANTYWVYLDKVKSSSTVSVNFNDVFQYLGKPGTVAFQCIPSMDNVQVFSESFTDAQISASYDEVGDPLLKKISISVNGVQCPVEVVNSELRYAKLTNHYLMDDTGSVLTAEVGGVDGTITNLTSVTGKFGNALYGGDTGGTSRYATFDSDIYFKSVSFWVKRYGTTHTERILTAPNGTYLTIRPSANGNFIGIYSGAQRDSNLTITESTTLHNITLVEESEGNYWIYLDGVKSSTTIIADFQRLIRYVGKTGAVAWTATPTVDNIEFYANKLTDAQVKKLSDRTSLIPLETSVPLYAKIPTITASSSVQGRLAWDITQPNNDNFVSHTAEDDTTIFSETNDTWYVGATAYTKRVRIDKDVLAAGGCQFQIEFGRGSNNYTIDKLYIGEAADSGNDWDFDGNQVQVFFGGSASKTITADGTLSDPADLPFDGKKDLIIAYYQAFDAAWYRTGNPAGVQGWVLAGDSAADDAPSGYSTNSNWGLINSIISISPSKAVWDSDFVAVYHMAQNPTGGADSLFDSTIYGNHGTPQGTPELVNGIIGKAFDFDGTDSEYILIGDHASLDLSGPLTLEAFHNADSVTNHGILNKGPFNNNPGAYHLAVATAGSGFQIGVNGANYDQGGSPVIDTWYYQAGVYDLTDIDLFIDGSSLGSPTAYTTPIPADGNALRIANYYGAGFAYNGAISEVRISKIDRSASWIDLTNKSLRNTLLTWAAATTNPIPYSFDLRIPARSENLAGFPLTVVFDANAGTNNFNTDDIFHQLGDNWDKLIFTQDGIQLYAEVDKWVSTNAPIDKRAGDTYGDVHPSYPDAGFEGNTVVFSSQTSWYSYHTAAWQTTGSVGKDYGVDNKKIITKYSMYLQGASATTNPRNWKLQGSLNGTDWDDLDTITDWDHTQAVGWYEFPVSNTTPYRFYRINVSQNWGSTSYVIIGQLRFFEANNHGHGVLFVKAHLLDVETKITVNYDPSNSSQSAFIGVAGSAAAQNVWKNGFEQVWNFAQDPSGGASCVIDSTGNGWEGTPTGGVAAASRWTESPFYGWCYYYDSASDYVITDTVNSINSFYGTSQEQVFQIRGGDDWDGTSYPWYNRWRSTGYFTAVGAIGSHDYTPPLLYAPHYTAQNGVVGNTGTFYEDELTPTNGTTLLNHYNYSGAVIVGYEIGHVNRAILGTVSTHWISRRPRSSEWYNTNYSSLRNELIAWAHAETEDTSGTQYLPYRFQMDFGSRATELSDFPIAIAIHPNAGPGGFATMKMFDLLGSNWNKLIIRQGNYQKPAEVVNWNPDTYEALIYVLGYIPTTGAVPLSIDFDPSNPDQSSYIGVTGSAIAKTVWDDDFLAVWLMNQDPSGGAGCVLDSTANEHHATPQGNLANAIRLVDSPNFPGSKAFHINDDNSYFLTDDTDIVTSVPALTIETMGQRVSGTDWDGSHTPLSIVHRLGSTVNFNAPGALVTYNAISDWFSANGVQLATTWQASDGTVQAIVNGDIKNTGTGQTSNYTYGAAWRIGYESGHTNRTWYGPLAQFRLSKIVRSEDWLLGTYQGVSDTLLTWSNIIDFGSLEELLQWFDLEYNLMDYNPISNYFDEPYIILAEHLVNWVDEFYSIKLGAYFNEHYGDNPVLLKWFNEYYGDNPTLLRWFNLPYGDRSQLLKYWDLPYTIKEGLMAWFDENYAITEAPISQWFDENYNIVDRNSIQKWFDEIYQIIAGTIIETSQLIVEFINPDDSLYPGTHRVYPMHLNFEFNRNSYKAYAEMHFPDQESYLLAIENQTTVRIRDEFDDLYFQVEVPTENDTLGETTYIVPAESKSRVLERAEGLNETFPAGMASELASEIAGRYGITIDWQAHDWAIKSGLLYANDETPYEVIHKITQAIGAKMQPTTDGNLAVVRNMAVDSDQWDETAPEYYLTDGRNFFTTSEGTEERPGYNIYRISDYGISDENSWLEEEEVSANKKILKGFRVPFDEKQLVLYHSGGTWVQVIKKGTTIEEITEQVEVVNGEGKTDFPIYGLIRSSYKQASLGNITPYEEGRIVTEVKGQSLVEITYQTKYWGWTARDEKIEDVQFWIEAE